MILIISEHIFDIYEMLISKNLDIHSCLVGINDCLLINIEDSSKEPSEFKEVFDYLGLTHYSSRSIDIKKSIPVIYANKEYIPEYIELRKDFNKENIHMVVEILVAMCDGYEVENHIDVLKNRFDEYFNQ